MKKCVALAVIGLLLSSCVTYSVPSGQPTAQVTIVKANPNTAAGATLDVYDEGFVNERALGDRVVTRYDETYTVGAGSRLYLTLMSNHMLVTRTWHCTNYFSFVPAAGRRYLIRQSSVSDTGCHVTIVEEGSSAVDPTFRVERRPF